MSGSSALKTPLNKVLNSKSNLLVLREVTDLKDSTTHSELIERTGLSRQGVYNAVNRLVETGLITYVGSGSKKQIKLRIEYPLSGVIQNLFEAEKERYKSLFSRIKHEVEAIDKPPKSVWVFGKVAQEIDDYGDPLKIALLGSLNFIDEQTEQFRDKLYKSNIELDFDVTIDIRGITKADLELRSELINGKIIPLWGMDPKSYLENYDYKDLKGRTHKELDKESFYNAKAWSKLLKKYPDIINRTKMYLENRTRNIKGGEKKEFEEWIHILNSMSYQRLKKFLESDSERSTRLRQSLPFWGILKENEREELEKLKKEEDLK